jgi:predicted nucleic acid-binding protein
VALTGYLFDTSVINRLAHPAIADAVERRGTQRVLCRCAVVDLEILYSATSPERYLRLRTMLEGGFTDLPITTEVMVAALDIQQRLAALSQHRGVSIGDLIVGACALVHKATVVHYDADYDRIAAVTGQSTEWVVPTGTVD